MINGVDTSQDRVNRGVAELLRVGEVAGSQVAELSVAARVLAGALFQAKGMPCTEKKRCLDAEGEAFKALVDRTEIRKRAVEIFMQLAVRGFRRGGVS